MTIEFKDFDDITELSSKQVEIIKLADNLFKEMSKINNFTSIESKHNALLKYALTMQFYVDIGNILFKDVKFSKNNYSLKEPE